MRGRTRGVVSSWPNIARAAPWLKGWLKVVDMERPADVAALREQIVLQGLPCRLWLTTQPWGWSCLDVEPAEGFIHLCAPEQVEALQAQGWHYHITLGYHIPLEVLAEVASRWDGARVVLPVWRVNEWSCVARLDSTGVGGCPWVLRAIELGDPDRVWFGPHVSM